MKLQTSGVLGRSYAIAKLAPKRVFDRDEDGEYNIGDLFNWVHEYFFGKNTPTVEKKITRNVISLYDKVYKNYDAYFEQSITQDIDIPTTTNAWSVRQSSHTQDVCKKVFDKVKEKAILSFTFVNRGVYVEEYTLEGKTHKIAIYSYKDRFELLSENITFASLQDLKTNNYIKAAYNSKYGLIFLYGTTGELLMTIQIISDTPLQTTITWLNYLGIVTKSNQQEEDKEIEIKVKELNVTIQTKQKVEEIWDGDRYKEQEEIYLNNVTWVGQYNESYFKNCSCWQYQCCNKSSNKILELAGTSTDRTQQIWVLTISDDNCEVLKGIKSKFVEMKHIIDKSLFIHKLPIIVGVNHPYKGVYKCSGNIPKSTNHYVVIVGKGFDKKQKKSFYYFYEVGTKIKANGISKDNKLYIDNLLNIIVGNPSTKTTHKEYYRVTEVRKNHNQTY